MEIKLKPIEDQDVEDLLADITSEDRAEILAMGVSPEWGVNNSLATAIESVAIRVDGPLGCLTGVSHGPGLAEWVVPWMLMTNHGRKYPISILRVSRKIIRRWQGEFPYMKNYVDSRHCAAVEWLAWLGADLTFVEHYGPFRRPFYKFEFGAPSCA